MAHSAAHGGDTSSMDHNDAAMPGSMGGNSAAAGGHAGHGGLPVGDPGCTDNGSVVPYVYTDAWVFLLMLIQCVVIPIGFYFRSKGIKNRDASVTMKGHALIGFCWFLLLVCTLGSSNVNVAPLERKFDIHLVFGIWLIALPTYLFFRDFAPDGCSKICCRCLSPETAHLIAKFWDYAVCGISSFGLTIVSFWKALGYYELDTDIGHLIPALGFMGYAGLLLYNSGPHRRTSIDLMRGEAYMWLAWGSFFDFYFTAIQVGLVAWTFGEQHLYQALMYVWTGGTALFMSKLNIRTGFPMFTLCWTMGIMMFHHLQPCPLLSMMHQTTGLFFLITGVFRYLDRILEASFFMTMASVSFAFSGNSVVYFANPRFDSMSYIFFVMVLGGTWWAYMAWLFLDDWHVEDEGSQPYAPVATSVKAVDRADEEMGDVRGG